MLDEGTKVVLATDLPEYGLSAGDTGTIMLTYDAGENGEPDYEVYFEKIDVSVILRSSQFTRG